LANRLRRDFRSSSRGLHSRFVEWQDAWSELQGRVSDGLRHRRGAEVSEDEAMGEGEESEGHLNCESVRGKERQHDKFMKMKTIAVGLLAVGAIALIAADIKVDVSKLPPAATKTGVTFDADIKPMFEKSCF